MKNTERRKYEMLSRVRDFGASRAASFPAGTRGGELFARLAAVVAELESHAEAQTSRRSAASQGATSKDAARAALRESLEAVSRTARAMAFESPGLDERFRLPRGNNDQSLVSTARAFLTDAEPLKAEFVRHELPADFLDTLRVRIEEFERASASQNNNRDAHVAATSAIGAAVERGVVIVRQLDAVVRNKFGDDAATLAAWTSASHTERTPRARKTAQPGTPAPPAS